MPEFAAPSALTGSLRDAEFKVALRESLAPLGLSPAREAEIVEELSQHLQDRHEELVLRGSAPEAAERALLEEIRGGGLLAGLREAGLRAATSPASTPAPALGQDPSPGESSPGFLRGLWSDLWYAARQLRLNRTFTAVAVLSLALGTGANTAIFQLVDTVRMRALPVPEAEQLALVRVPPGPRSGEVNGRAPFLTYAVWKRVEQGQQAFGSIAAWSNEPFELARSGASRRAEGLWVTGSFFETLRVAPQAGRLLSAADDRPGCGSPGVVLSDGFWRREYGGAPDVVGRAINLDGRPFEVLGVSGRGFFGPEVGRAFDVALPVCAEPLMHPEGKRIENPQAWWLGAIGRLKPGVSVAQASAQLTAISPAVFRETLPPSYDAVDRESYLGFKLVALPGETGVSSMRNAYEKPLWLLMGIAGLVLLIACANLANLMLARASARQREMAVRLALGASRARVIRQLLVESLLLASLGTLCGTALAQLLVRGLVSFLTTEGSAIFVDVAPGGRTLLFTAGVAVLTCLLFGLTPALEASRTSPREALQASARGVLGGASRFGLRRVLVVAQVALSLVLFVGALLFVGTFRNLITVDTGFSRESVVVTSIDLNPYRLPVEKRLPTRLDVLSRLRALPGVTAAAIADIVPLAGAGWNEVIQVDGRTSPPGSKRWIANFNRVSSGYFGTLSTPLLAGRDFDKGDSPTSPKVAVVTETFVKRFLSVGESPIGHSVSHSTEPGKPDSVYEIVGVVKDVKYRDLREDAAPLVFVAATQDPNPEQGVQAVVRSSLPPDETGRSIQAMLAQSFPAALVRSRPYEAIVRESLVRERLMATLSGFFGVLAAILAMVGLYGVISYMVSRRRGEIGVRMALGADARDIVSMVLREAGMLLVTGLVVGTALAVAGSSAAKALLYGFTPGDPRAIALAIVSLGTVAALASAIPARRAAMVDPVQALRE